MLAGIGLVACTPEAYKRSADLQVNQILRDRSKQTLGYTPQVDTPTTVPAMPTKKAYAKIPVTAMAAPTTSPLEPVSVVVPYGPLGPNLLWRSELTPPADVLGVQAANLRASQRLQLGPPAPWDVTRKLDLFGSLDYAVQHARNYQDQMESLYLATLDVTLQRHLFDPRPFVRTSARYAGGQADVNYRSAFTAANSAGIRQQLPYGGEIVAETLVQFVDALNDQTADGESASVALSGSIPLLRGAGLVNLHPLINSERQVIYAVRSFETFRRSFAVDIASRYFRLLTQLQGINNRRVNYDSLVLLTERTEALYLAGRLKLLDVQRSLQAQLSAENGVILAQEAYQSALDDFKLALGMPMEESIQIVPIEVDVPVPPVDNEGVVAMAMKYRLDLQTAKDQIDDARRTVAAAQNSLLPDLDVTGQADLGNRSDTPAKALDTRTQTYSAGVTLDWPVDRVAERNAYRRSLIQLERSHRAYSLARDQVMTDVRDAVRGIRSAQATLEIQRRGVELAQQRLDLSTELLIQGKVDARDAVDSQSSLLTAQDAYNVARSQLQIQVLTFLRDTGTLRVDPQAGSLGHAMDRAALAGNETAPRW